MNCTVCKVYLSKAIENLLQAMFWQETVPILVMVWAWGLRETEVSRRLMRVD